jgi:hypothetical protein
MNRAAIRASVGSGFSIALNVLDGRRAGQDGSVCRFNLSQLDEVAAIQQADSTDGMQHSRLLPRSCDPLPSCFVARLAVFTDLFTRPTWPNSDAARRRYPGARPAHCHGGAAHSRARARSRFLYFPSRPQPGGVVVDAAGRLLLVLLIKVFVPAGEPVVIGAR